MSLKEKMLKKNSNEGIPFMSERTAGKLDEILNQKLTIKDFAFLNKDGQDYTVFIVDEIKDSFYFGGSVITGALKDLSDEDIKEVRESGLPVEFYEGKSKNNRKYYAAKFYPDEVEDDLPF